MISIIISSYQPEYFAALENNIAETVGVPYEIVKIDNPGTMGVCAAYNKGAEKAKFEYLLFLHEDVLFHTDKWAEKLIKHLQVPGTGVVGVAGSDYVPVVPCGWYVNSPPHQFLNLIQSTKDSNTPSTLYSIQKEKYKVFALDGVFLAMKAEVYKQFKFNERITVFHGYDADISLHVAKKYQNYVISNILIEHFSLGGADKNFFEANLFVRKLHGSNYQFKHDSNIEFERFKNFVYSMFRFHGISLKNTFKTFPFIPWGKIKPRDYLEIIKMYLRYFKYRNYFQEKFGT